MLPCPRSLKLDPLLQQEQLLHNWRSAVLLSIPQSFLKAGCFHSSLNNCHHLFNPARPGADRISWCLLPVSRYCDPRPPSLSFSPKTLKLLWLHLSQWVGAWRKEAINSTECFCITWCQDGNILFSVCLKIRQIQEKSCTICQISFGFIYLVNIILY